MKYKVVVDKTPKRKAKVDVDKTPKKKVKTVVDKTTSVNKTCRIETYRKDWPKVIIRKCQYTKV